jgi:hypothetical protein
MKRLILQILLISLILLGLSTGCVSKKAIKDEFVNDLLQTNTGTIDKVDSELRIVDQNLYVTEEKLLELEQVVGPALEWIEKQKVELLDEHKYGSWHSRVTPESLAQFKNDQYQVTALELLVHGIGTPDQKFDTVIKVMDLSTKIPSDWETIENELKGRKSILEQQRQITLEAGHLSSSTLLSVIEHSGDWAIQKINSTTYSISGPGLGIAGELTTGNWTYNRASQEIIPSDNQSSALQDILSGGL